MLHQIFNILYIHILPDGKIIVHNGILYNNIKDAIAYYSQISALHTQINTISSTVSTLSNQQAIIGVYTGTTTSVWQYNTDSGWRYINCNTALSYVYVCATSNMPIQPSYNTGDIGVAYKTSPQYSVKIQDNGFYIRSTEFMNNKCKLDSVNVIYTYLAFTFWQKLLLRFISLLIN